MIDKTVKAIDVILTVMDATLTKIGVISMTDVILTYVCDVTLDCETETPVFLTLSSLTGYFLTLTAIAYH